MKTAMELLKLSFVHEKHIATLETQVRALEKYCHSYRDAIAGYQQIVTKQNTTIDALGVQFDKLLKDYLELIGSVKDRAAQDRARVDAIDAHLKTRADDDATETAA